MTLPMELLAALRNATGGKLALITGAGTSIQPPTGLETARTYATQVHAELLAEHTLAPHKCTDPSDLSAVAEEVVKATGSQVRLVERLPFDRFRLARPNDGHLIAIALMKEQIVGSVLTLNFDLALTNAITELGGSTITILRGPEDFAHIGNINLMYLHRDAWAAFPDWVLTTTALGGAWRDGWAGLMAERVTTTPLIVFAGLGTPSAVLTDCVERVRTAVGDGAVVIQVGRSDQKDSSFAKAVKPNYYLKQAWCEFMREVGQAVAQHQAEQLRELAQPYVSGDEPTRTRQQSLLTELSDFELVELGRVRAMWRLSEGYDPFRGSEPLQFLDLVLAIPMVEAAIGPDAVGSVNGTVEIWREDQLIVEVLPTHGRGVMRWTEVEEAVRGSARFKKRRRRATALGLLAGFVGPKTTTPPNITGSEPPDDILAGRAGLILIDAHEMPPSDRLRALIKRAA